jgi:bacteriocin biosynthesis cyclodehydratase domain-containing protein
MLPKLKGDTFFIPTPDGIYFRNNQGSFKIKGKVVYRWIESLAPYLTGEHSLAKITAGLNSEKQAMVNDLVNTLLKQGFLKDLSQDLPHNLSQTERETYAAEIAFVDSFCDSAAARFERFREQQVLLTGSGLTLTALVKASLKSGLRQVAVITTPECETNTRRHQEYLDLFHKGDPRQTLTEIDAPAWDNEAEVLSRLSPFDTIIHVSDRPMLARASMLNRLCVTYNKNLLQAVIVDDRAWIGPLVRGQGQDAGSAQGTAPTTGCWECTMLRLQGNLTNMQAQLPLYAFQDQTTYEANERTGEIGGTRTGEIGGTRTGASPVPTAFVANMLSFEIFKSVTEAGPVETKGHLIEVNLETLRTQKHAFMPHPLCHTCQHPEPRTAAQFLETIQQLEQGEEARVGIVPRADPTEPSADEDRFSKQVTPCFETRLGLFSSLDEGDLVQLPLSVCKAVVSNPMPQEQTTNPPAVLGFGFSFGAARKRAAQRACEVYTANLVDRRRLPSVQTVGIGSAQDIRIGASPVPTIPAERFLSSGSAQGTTPTVKDWTWATDLSTGEACLVPATLAYPVLLGLSPQGDAGVGIGSGTTWAEAVGQALLSVCRYLTITQIEGAQKPYPQVSPTTITLSPDETRLLHILEQMGGSVTVYDVTGSLQVPTLAICLEDQTVAYGTHVDIALALQDGLEQAVLYKQLSGEQILVDNLPFTLALPLSLRGEMQREARAGATSPVPVGPSVYDVSQEWPNLKSWLQDVLQMDGWQAFAVPLDHDPVLREIQPYIVHVLVAHAENQEGRVSQ